MSKKTTDLFNKYVQEGRAPGTPSIKRYTRNDGTTALKSLNKWGKRKDWRDTEGGLAKAKEHAGVDKITESMGNIYIKKSEASHQTDTTIWPDSDRPQKLQTLYHRTEGEVKNHIKSLKNKYGAKNVDIKVTKLKEEAEEHAGVNTISEDVPCAEPITTDPNLPTSRLIGTNSIVNVFKKATPGQSPKELHEGLVSLAKSALPAAKKMVSTVLSKVGKGKPAPAPISRVPGVQKGAQLRGTTMHAPSATATTTSPKLANAFSRAGVQAAPQAAVSRGLASRGVAAVSRGASTIGKAVKGARLIPGLQTVAGLGMAGYNAAKGDWVGAGLSLGSAVPGPIGWGFTGLEVARQLAKGDSSDSKAPEQAAQSPTTTTAQSPQVAQSTPKLQGNQPPQAAKQPKPSTSTVVSTKGGEYKVYNKDSDEAKSFRSEFAKNRRAGAKEFTWQGRKYSTAVAEAKSLDESFELAFDYQGKPQLAPTAGNLMMQAKGAFAYHDDVQNVMDVKAIKESIQKQFEQTVLEEDTEELAEKCEILADMVEHALRTIDTIKESNLERDAWSEAQILKLESYIESVAKYIDNITEAGDVVADVVGVVVPAYKVTDPRTGKVRYVKGRTVKKKQRRKIGDGEDNDEPKGPLSV